VFLYLYTQSDCEIVTARGVSNFEHALLFWSIFGFPSIFSLSFKLSFSLSRLRLLKHACTRDSTPAWRQTGRHAYAQALSLRTCREYELEESERERACACGERETFTQKVYFSRSLECARARKIIPSLSSLAVYCSVLQRVAVCCSVLQCVAGCNSVLQCVAACCCAFARGRERHLFLACC